MNVKLYDSANCPCTSSCNKHGDCEACKEAHHSKGSKTFCERAVVTNKENIQDEFSQG